MKKLIALFLLTALCLTFLTSCNMRGGLVAELWGELKEMGNGIDVEPSVDVSSQDVYVYPDTAFGTETVPIIEPRPPVEYTTQDYGWATDAPVTEEVTSDAQYDPPYPDDVFDLSGVLTLDGDLSDWNTQYGAAYTFDQSNLDPWVGYVQDKGFTMYTAADGEYVYFALDVADDTVLASDDAAYNGDAFQIMIDFNAWIAYVGEYERGIFYSFGLQKDGSVDITVQCIEGDDDSTIDYTMASDDDSEGSEGTVKGITKVKEDGSGWIAEYAVSWETLYRDVCNKLLPSGVEIPEVRFGYDKVMLSMTICYLDHDVDAEGSDAGIVGAWGTSAGLGQLSSGEGWYPENAGVSVAYQPLGYAWIESLFKE